MWLALKTDLDWNSKKIWLVWNQRMHIDDGHRNGIYSIIIRLVVATLENMKNLVVEMEFFQVIWFS